MTTQELKALREMSEREIRKAQDLVRAQIISAHRTENTTALVKLQEWEQDYTEEMIRRLMDRVSA